MQTLSSVMLSNSQELVADFQHLNPKSIGNVVLASLLSKESIGTQVKWTIGNVVHILFG